MIAEFTSPDYSKLARYDELYLDIAERVSDMSHCLKKKVGCVLVRDGRIISMGWNGMPRGFNNVCETNGKTKQEVIHAEENAIAKVAKSSDTSDHATLFSTMAPCVECAKLIIQSGISRVVYNNRYRYDIGLELLESAGVKVDSKEIQGR